MTLKAKINSLALTIFYSFAYSQINDAKDGYYADFTDASTYCWINAALPNNGGVMNGDGSGDSTSFTADHKLTAEGLVLVSNTGDAFNATAREQYFQIPVFVDANETPDDDTNGYCSKASEEYGVNITNYNSIFYITVSSDVEGAELQLFLGGEGEWGPATNSGSNEDGDGIVPSVTVSTEERTYVIDFTDPDFDPSENLTAYCVWDAWIGKNDINSFGFRSATPGATFIITEISFGFTGHYDYGYDQGYRRKKESCTVSTSALKETAAFMFYPNPTQSTLTVEGLAFTDIVVITDLLGEEVIQSDKNTIDLSNITNGTYFAQILRENEIITVEKIQIIH